MSWEKIIDILIEAGSAILDIEKRHQLNKRFKDDHSPVTDADLLSDNIIRNRLNRLNYSAPILSEESLPAHSGPEPDEFWLLDPLDGTKEFIKGNGEYCISLALIRNGRPVEAYIHAPASRISWYAFKGQGVFMIKDGLETSLPVIKANRSINTYTMYTSRSHHGSDEENWLKKARLKAEIENVPLGSAVKFCKMAEGEGDFYIKKGRIFGWDIAAGDLILEESGGTITSYENRRKIRYSFSDTPIPWFLASGFRITDPGKWLF